MEKLLKATLTVAMLTAVSAGCRGQKADDGASRRIVVLSDTHVMGPGLLVSEGKAWTDYLGNERKLTDLSRQLFDEQIEALKVMAPDLLLVTGDLTKDGERASHEYVVARLGELPATTKVLVIPGNHDRGTTTAKIYDGASATNAPVYGDADFAAAYAAYGYGADSRRDEASLSYACEPLPGLVVIGIDSKNGALAGTTVDWVCGEAAQARTAGKQVIAMMHHALIPHITNAENFVSTAVIDDYDHLRQRFIEAGIKVVFTGHFHVSDIAKDYNNELTDSIYDVATGAPVSYPCDRRVVTLSGDCSRMDITTERITTLAGVDNFSEVARERLHGAIKKNMKARAEAKAGSLAGFFSTAIDRMATAFADAYIIHAEGNEPEADAAKVSSIFEDLEFAFSVLSGSEDMMKSMLYDKSPYGKAGRENVTDDRTLTVRLSSQTTAVGTVGPTAPGGDVFYTLTGLRTSRPQRGVYINSGRLLVF
ncbi:MAG: metallophosphoesterase [Prevotella sp.]|nr:metallophosphoesterase [Prevotella sp.]